MNFDVSPMPNHTMNSGMNASGGSGRVISIIGSTRWRTSGTEAIAPPMATPMTTPTPHPARIRRGADQRVLPQRLPDDRRVGSAR